MSGLVVRREELLWCVCVVDGCGEEPILCRAQRAAMARLLLEVHRAKARSKAAAGGAELGPHFACGFTLLFAFGAMNTVIDLIPLMELLIHSRLVGIPGEPWA